MPHAFSALPLAGEDGAVVASCAVLRNGSTPGREYSLRNGVAVLLRSLMTTGMPRYENYPTEAKSRITALPMGRPMMATDLLIIAA